MSTADKDHADQTEADVKSGREMRDDAPPSAPTLLGLLQQRAARYRDKVAFSFSFNGEDDGTSLTYQQLEIKARAIAASLQQQGVAGERVLVLFHPGLDFIAGFFGCLYADKHHEKCPRNALGASRRNARETADRRQAWEVGCRCRRVPRSPRSSPRGR